MNIKLVISMLIIHASAERDQNANYGTIKPKPNEPPPIKNGFKMAFLADTGIDDQTKILWRLLKRDNVNLLIHPGDFAYRDKFAHKFVKAIDEIFPRDVAYVSTVGDHDLNEFDDYKRLFVQRDLRTPGLECEGQWGVAAVCVFKGVVVISAGPGFFTENYRDFLKITLKNFEKWPWKICTWHRTGENMEVGGKKDKINNEFYDICREYGALILTGHQHIYSRSHLMSHFNDRTVSEVQDDVLRPGTSMLLVTGLSRSDARPWKYNLLSHEMWISTVAKQNFNGGGAVICEYKTSFQGFACKYLDINGIVHDRFMLKSEATSGPAELDLNVDKFDSADVLNTLYKKTSIFSKIHGHKADKRGHASDNQLNKSYQAYLHGDRLIARLKFMRYPAHVDLTTRSELGVPKRGPAKWFLSAKLAIVGPRYLEEPDDKEQQPRIIFKCNHAKYDMIWFLKERDISEARDKAVWVSPELKDVALACYMQNKKIIVETVGNFAYQFWKSGVSEGGRLPPTWNFQYLNGFDK